MQYFCLIVVLFVTGCVLGWVIEFFFRRIFTAKRWVNPGFMIGPYLPLYGFGVATMFAIFWLTYDITEYEWANILIGTAIIGVAMTVIELIAGLIFIKGMKIKLWDYSNRKGNFMGIICPLFSVIWLFAGLIFYLLAFYPLAGMLQGIVQGQQYIVIFFGIVLGIMIMDFAVSMYYSKQVKKFNQNADMRYDDLKMSFRHQYNFKEKKNHFYGIIDISSDTATTLPEAIEEFARKHPDVDMMNHYAKEGMQETKENPFAERKEINKKPEE